MTSAPAWAAVMVAVPLRGGTILAMARVTCSSPAPLSVLATAPAWLIASGSMMITPMTITTPCMTSVQTTAWKPP